MTTRKAQMHRLARDLSAHTGTPFMLALVFLQRMVTAGREGDFLHLLRGAGDTAHEGVKSLGTELVEFYMPGSAGTAQ